MKKSIQYGATFISVRWKVLGKYLLFSLLVFTSCIKEDPEACPPLQVNITVKDKNYFNVDNLPIQVRRSETLPFREYIPTLHYILRDAETGSLLFYCGLRIGNLSASFDLRT